MNKRQLGNSELYISEIGLGCMSLGTDEVKAKSIIDTALDSGINYLDTADLYDFGKNEKIVGQAIKGKRDQVIIGTKGGNHFEANQDGWYWDPSKAYLKEAFKNSLLRLGLDYVDLYQLHGGTIEDPTDEVIELFEELKQEGLIRYYGISSIRPNVIKRFLQTSNLSSIMMQYSIIDRRPEEFLDLIHEHGVSVVVRGALGKGMLTEHGINIWKKKGQKGFLDYDAHELKNIITGLEQLANEAGVTTQSLAIGYTLKHPAISSLILGASKQEQIIENVKAYYESFISDDIFEKIKQMTKKNQYDSHRD
ncbi:aldo/keto reductase [Bacillaceae bacterium W0354]